MVTIQLPLLQLYHTLAKIGLYQKTMIMMTCMTYFKLYCNCVYTLCGNFEAV